MPKRKPDANQDSLFRDFAQSVVEKVSEFGVCPPPLPLQLLCPRCGEQHADVELREGLTGTAGSCRELSPREPLLTHRCLVCNHVWRPFDFATVGVVSNVKVISVRDGAPHDAYIGRYNKSWNLAESKWKNPYKLVRESDAETVLRKYRAHVLSQPELVESLPELDGKVIACWCKPKPCHGDVLAALVAEHSSGVLSLRPCGTEALTRGGEKTSGQEESQA